MSDLIDRAALLARMEETFRQMEADMLASGNAAYLRGYRFALLQVKSARRAQVEAAE